MIHSIEEVFSFYEDKISPAYAYLVALTGEKPVQVLVEIENTFAHLSKFVQGSNPEGNLNKAYNHLVRLYIDLYKLLLVEVRTYVVKRETPAKLDFINHAKKARQFELANIGKGNTETILEVGSKYAAAINIGLKDLNLDPI